MNTNFLLNRYQLDQVAKNLVDPQEPLEASLQAIRDAAAPLLAFQVRAAGLKHWKQLAGGKSLKELVEASAWKNLPPSVKKALSRRVRKHLDCLA